MKKDTYIYPAVFTYEDGYEIAVIFHDLELATCGTDDADALKMAKEALGGRLLMMEEDNDDFPIPTPLKDIPLEENERVALVEVFMPSVRLANVNKSVNRTVTLPAWLNSLALEKGVNFSHVLQDALKQHLTL